jgi:hypothetical protein
LVVVLVVQETSVVVVVLVHIMRHLLTLWSQVRHCRFLSVLQVQVAQMEQRTLVLLALTVLFLTALLRLLHQVALVAEHQATLQAVVAVLVVQHLHLMARCHMRVPTTAHKATRVELVNQQVVAVLVLAVVVAQAQWVETQP